MNHEFRMRVLPGDRNVVYVSVRWHLKSLDKMTSLRASVWKQKRGREKNWGMKYSPGEINKGGREGAASVAGRKN